MPQLDRPGRFKAFPQQCGLQEKQSGCVQWCAIFAITQMFDDESKEWVDVSDQQWTIPGYVVVIKKNVQNADGSVTPGELNTPQIENLKTTLGWDGASFDGLCADFSQVCVQITVAPDEYQGKTRLKVDWVNPENWEGAQLKTIDDSALKTLNSKFGARLRQMNSKAAAPAPASTGPKTPPKPLPPKPAAPAKQY